MILRIEDLAKLTFDAPKMWQAQMSGREFNRRQRLPFPMLVMAKDVDEAKAQINLVLGRTQVGSSSADFFTAIPVVDDEVIAKAEELIAQYEREQLAEEEAQ